MLTLLRVVIFYFNFCVQKKQSFHLRGKNSKLCLSPLAPDYLPPSTCLHFLFSYPSGDLVTLSLEHLTVLPF